MAKPTIHEPENLCIGQDFATTSSLTRVGARVPLDLVRRKSQGDTAPVDDCELPQTGVPMEIEKQLCTAFVNTTIHEVR